ncbi:Wall-associated receptor kinase, galacturonan-binding domain [Dillenia turbinata]|uniref:non-specific serine/threonine protein kinase n=1 Tax=Dillenia turbinata TaxID=194707 RepID=A0AAN8Z5C4_9MAGN
MPLSLPLHLLLSLSFLFCTPTSIAEESSANYACTLFSKMCGDVNISYPFWQINDSALVKDICGLSEFGLYCPDNSSNPTLQLPGDNYIVKDINYSDHTLTLVDADVTTQHTSCPRARDNLTLDNTIPLIYSSLDVNLSFYFNCTSDPPDPVSSYLAPIECLKSDENTSYVGIILDYDVTIYDWSRSCEENVVAAVMENQVTNHVNYTFDEAMKNGFVLNWTKTNDCVKCEGSGGKCGFDNSTSGIEFRCFCSNGKVCKHDCSSGMFPIPTLSVIDRRP